MKVIALVSTVGGLTATREVLSGLPADLPAAVIVLEHLSPEHASFLPELIRRDTPMPVHAVEDDAEVLAGHVYVAPPGYHTLVTSGPRFSLVASGVYPPSRPSADLLLTTLALASGPDAIAVVMTGAGNDGAAGAAIIHKHGGMVLATDMATSQNFSMPAATIARDQVTTAVLPVPEVAHRLIELVCAPAHGDPSIPQPGRSA